MDLRRKRRAGDRPVGGWCSFPSPSVAEALATAAFDFVTIDTEHAPATIETVENGIRAVEAAPGPTEPLVRVAEVDATRIARVLDAETAGVPVGTLATSEERIDAWLDAGFDFLIVGTDAGFLVAGADRAIERYEESV